MNDPYYRNAPYIANLSVHDNILEDLGAYGMCMKGVHSNSGTCSIYNNTIKNTGLVWVSDGNKKQGISVGPFWGSVYTNIYNNTITNTVGPGIRITGAEFRTNAHNIYGNKILGCGTGNDAKYGNGIVLIFHTTGVDIYDNIIIQPTRYGIWAQNSTVGSTDSRNLIGDAGQGKRYVRSGGSMTEGTGADADIYHADVADFGFKAWSDDGDYSNDDFSFGNSDTANPVVTSFTSNKTIVNINEAITINYTVTDNKALKQVELWRTTDSGGVPNSGNWAKINTKTVSGTSASGSFTDSLSTAGTYWYGIHVVDQAGNAGLEPNPVKVVVNSGGTAERKFTNTFLYRIGATFTPQDVIDVHKYDLIAVQGFRWAQVNGDTWVELKKLNPD
ncbi:MAG: right-handed parallel beta-helix repeat-containing protein, partial [Sedimentisphaerales bacterium]|nr:right-handed parallel beta-helix repeat-containing protein [Sedimentisphaerales bacterium]